MICASRVMAGLRPIPAALCNSGAGEPPFSMMPGRTQSARVSPWNSSAAELARLTDPSQFTRRAAAAKTCAWPATPPLSVGEVGHQADGAAGGQEGQRVERRRQPLRAQAQAVHAGVSP